jgi:anti-sigma factor RsiW
MNHDPEQWAAAYLEGMPARERVRFEGHLLTCEACWREISLARAGRALAESLQERAPAGLRETIRASVAAAAADARPSGGRHRRTGVLAAVAVVVVLLGVLAVGRPWQHPGPSGAAPGSTAAAGSTVAEAVARFRQEQLPGTAVPAQRAPDLGPLGLRLVGAAAGTLQGEDVTVFAYRAGSGSRLEIYRSAHPIPEAGEAHELDGDEDAWRTEVDGLTVICGPATHTVLLIGSDPGLVDRAGELLDLV